jgi:DNA polymerase-3 subunit epsilon
VGRSLLADEEFRATILHVIDFEATTPRGYRPEPIEVAVISLSLRGAGLAETARFTGLMYPPGHARSGR